MKAFTILNILDTAIFGLPILLLLFPIGAGIGSYLWTRYNTETGKSTLKPNWNYVLLFFFGALILLIIINLITG